MNVLAIYCDEDKCIPKLYSFMNRSGNRSGNRSALLPDTCMKDYSLLDNDIFNVMFNAVNIKKGVNKVNPRRYTRKREPYQVNKKMSKKKNRKK